MSAPPDRVIDRTLARSGRSGRSARSERSSSARSALDVVVGGLDQLEEDVLHVLADVTRLGQRG
ncbi:hypothetical protein ACWDUH_19745, partial [Micromonospora wenchangensis]